MVELRELITPDILGLIRQQRLGYLIEGLPRDFLISPLKLDLFV